MNRSMQRSTAVLLFVLLLVGSLAGSAEARKKPWEQFKYASLGDVVMPAYERVELENGMILYLAEDHEFPLVELSATFRAASLYDPADKVGLADICGTVLRTGGTTAMTGDELDAYLESRGMILETYIGETEGGCFLSALKNDLDDGLRLMADILLRPVFDEDKIKLAQEQAKAGISRRNDDPMSIAQREAAKIIFGADHPLARHPEYDTINSITRADLQAFHQRYFQPEYTYLVVLGDFDSAAMAEKIRAAFADWRKSGQSLPPDPEIPAFPRTVNMVDKTDLTQSTVILAHKGILASDPNYAAIQVANRILGGGFSSRLFNEVRSNRGYAYSVGSAAGTGFRFPGFFMAFTMTKSGSTQIATQVILEEIQKMIDQPVTADELAKAKDGILTADVFNYTDKRRVLDRLVSYEMNGYPQDFLQRYMEAVRGLTAQDLQRAAGEVWHPERMSILAVGNAADFDGDLTTFGPVNRIDITIPEPERTMDVPAPTAETLARGQEWMTACRKAMGDGLRGLRTYSQKQTLALSVQGMTMEIKMEQTTVLPDRSYTRIVIPMVGQTQEIVFVGDQGWAKSPMGQQDMDAEQLADARAELSADLPVLLKNLEALQCQAFEPVEVDGVLCHPVYVTGAGPDYQLIYLDAGTHLPRMIQSPDKNPMTEAPVLQKVYFESFANRNGVSMPKSFTIRHDDAVFATGTMEEFVLNPEVDEGLFARP